KNRIRMTGGRVQGILDLSDANLVYGLHFKGCIFADGIDLRQARAAMPVKWDGGEVGRVLADGFESSEHLIIRNVTVAGLISLHRATVNGDVRLSGSRVIPEAGYAVYAEDLRGGGTLFLDGEDFQAQGEVCLQRAQVGRLRATGGTFTSATTYALRADALLARNGVYLDRGFRATATVRLVDANIIGELACTQGSFSSTSSRALDAQRIV